METYEFRVELKCAVIEENGLFYPAIEWYYNGVKSHSTMYLFDCDTKSFALTMAYNIAKELGVITQHSFNNHLDNLRNYFT